MFLTLLTFLAGVLIVVAIYSLVSDLFLRDRSRVSQRVDDEFRQRQRDKARRSTLFKSINEMATEATPSDEGPTSLRQRLEAMIEQAGMDFPVGRLVTLTVGIGLGVGAVIFLLLKNPFAAAVAAVFSGSIPLAYVYIKQQARLYKMLSQLPDAFDLMARVVRAGQTMSQALLAVADEFEQPLAAEFAYCYEQQNLGLPPELAMRDLARRTGLLEIKIFVLAMLVQQQTGGNLAEILEKLATVVRQRFLLRGKIKALTAEGRMQAAVLLSLPPFMFFLMLLLNRNYGMVLWENYGLLIAVFVSEVLGALWIRKIINFDF